MPNFTIRMGEDLKERMQARGEINWSHVIRQSVESKLDDLEQMNELAADSTLTEQDVEELADMITAAGAESAREDLAQLDPEALETALENRERTQDRSSEPVRHADTGH